MPGIAHRLRHAAGGVADVLLPGRCYGVFRLDRCEYVGRVDCDLETVTDWLENRSYSYIPLSAKKLHPSDPRADDGSYRKLDPADPAKQWHVHLWEDADGVQLFSHYELKPEPWGPLDLRRPVEHYWPEWGETCLLGQHCPAVKELLEAEGTYEGQADAIGSARLGHPACD